ncbi:MAG: hypothetical protein A2Y57_01935 [Candidatus Woykebacteria bacterium RBG_13_40_7b]|uniref:DUF2007 domain-containing protein n=1 Tax=Candidatus Woykebacteria bacterium RBG_13_40_7b TaxID=1802594 RepID=A0A1G1WAN6_9BACT|nr:MAG: hypothetical protein A2Y57_01935 [Candidatus Woykebacteria bacterium RBG_13_40_7b]
MIEVIAYTALNNETAQMLIEKLKSAGIPARVGSDSSWSGVAGVEASRTILVPEQYVREAKEILGVEES